MSNVLIGIIGVILFIGLALAGALFLGPRFQEASNASKGAAMSASVAQVAQAVEMYRVQEGTLPIGTALFSNLTPGYLKTMPGTGSVGSANWYALDDDGNPSTKPQWVILSVVHDDTGKAAAACTVVAKNAGMANADGSIPVRQKPDGAYGCYRYEGSWGYAQGLIGNYHFFHRI